LIQLIPEAKQAFYEAKLTVAHAFEIARLQPNDQRRALQECFPQYRNAAAILKDKKAEATTVRELRAWIEREIHLDLTNAPFDPQDETLLPKAGACARCPKRTGSNPLLFPEVRQKSICTDRECYRAKVEALVQIQVKPLEEKGEKPLRVSQAPAWQANGHAKDVLFEGQYRKAKAKGECPNTKAAVLIDGKGAGSIFYLCQSEKCDVHNRVTRYQPTPQEQTQRKKQALAERVEKQSRVRILDAILPRFRFGREIFGFQINQVWRIFVSRRVKLRTEIGAHCATVELDINILVTRLFDGVWSRCPSGEPQWPIPLTGKSSESQFLS
jgi:ParB family chromosome partitioning protein